MSEQGKINFLLIERYRVIDKYPGSPFKVGDILHKLGDDGYFFKGSERYPPDIDPASHENIFRKMFWYEYREVQHMPDYIRLINDLEYMGLKRGHIFKVISSGKFKEDVLMRLHPNSSNFYCTILGYGDAQFNYCHFLPASYAEYKDFMMKTWFKDIANEQTP